MNVAGLSGDYVAHVLSAFLWSWQPGYQSHRECLPGDLTNAHDIYLVGD